MKRHTVIAVASIAVLSGLSLGLVRSQDGTRQLDASNNKTVEQLQEELSVEVQKAFDGELDEYRGGRTAPMFVISLCRDLYAAQSAIVEPERAEALAMQYVDHALEIERMAKHHHQTGIGMRQYASAATAARLRAEIELKRVQQSN